MGVNEGWLPGRPGSPDRGPVGDGSAPDVSPARPQPSLNLHIEELGLHGFPAGDRYAIAQAVERELTRLLAERGAPPSWTQGGEIAHRDGGSFDVPPGSTAEAIGAQVARALYARLTERDTR